MAPREETSNVESDSSEETIAQFDCVPSNNMTSPSSASESIDEPTSASVDPPAKSQLASILKPSRWSATENITSSDRPSVQFATSIVASTTYRPYTPLSEVPTLYYSGADFAQFKREYRVLVNAQRERKARLAGDSNTSGGLMKDSSFWRNKAHGRYDASNGSLSQSSCSQREHSSSSSGIFSSVFDVAREAVSIFSNGAQSTNYSYYQSPPSPKTPKKDCPVAKQQRQQMLDTLYLNLF